MHADNFADEKSPTAASLSLASCIDLVTTSCQAFVDHPWLEERAARTGYLLRFVERLMSAGLKACEISGSLQGPLEQFTNFMVDTIISNMIPPAVRITTVTPGAVGLQVVWYFDPQFMHENKCYLADLLQQTRVACSTSTLQVARILANLENLYMLVDHGQVIGYAVAEPGRLVGSPGRVMLLQLLEMFDGASQPADGKHNADGGIEVKGELLTSYLGECYQNERGSGDKPTLLVAEKQNVFADQSITWDVHVSDEKLVFEEAGFYISDADEDQDEDDDNDSNDTSNDDSDEGDDDDDNAYCTYKCSCSKERVSWRRLM